MAAKTSKKKTNPLTSVLLQIEANPVGMPICAPTKLKEEVAAVQYSASGKPTKKLINLDIFAYLEETEERQFEIVQRKKLTQIPIKYYKLSARGKDHLREYYSQQEQERLKKLSSLNGIEEVIRENSTASKNLTVNLQQINSTPKTIAADVRQRMILEINKAHNQFREMLHNAQADIDKTVQSVQEQLNEKARQIEKHLNSLVNGQLQQNLEQCFASYNQNINHLGQQLHKHMQTETSLATALEQKLSLEKQKLFTESPTKSNYTQQGFEQDIAHHILSVLSSECLEEIPNIYKNVVKLGVTISPGHFNDILWKLAQEGKIRLKTWDRALVYLEQPEHAILRQEIFFYAIRLKE